jgi:hypothetical protein
VYDFGATDGYTEQNQNGDRNRMWQHGTNDRSTLTQTGDRNTNTSNQDAEIIIYRRIDKW